MIPVSIGIPETIRLDKEFYPASSLRRAISDFAEYLSARITDDRDYIALHIRFDPQYSSNSSTVVREFLNYALDLALKARFTAEDEASPDD